MTLDPLYPNIAFYGAPGAGKTTGALFLERLGFTRVSFAGYHKGGIRDIVARMGLDANDRHALNVIGMAAREVDPDVWVRNMLREVGWYAKPVVSDDMRGDNEWHALRAAGFVHVHVVADDSVREERLRLNGKLAGSDLPLLWILEDTTLYHPDYVVTNNDSEDELFAAVTDILNRERSKQA